MLVHHLCLAFLVQILSSNLLRAENSITTANPDAPPTYFVLDGNNYCIVLQGTLELFVPYNNTKNEIVNATVPVDKNAAADGSCDATTQTLNLKWGSHGEPSFNLSLTFSKLSASDKEETVVSSIVFLYNVSSVSNDSSETGIKQATGTGPYFNAPSTAYFTCTPQQNITLMGDASPDVLFALTALQMEAFRNSTTTDFSGQSFDCVQSAHEDNTIAIAIGVCFAVLIVLAIVVFLIGNRRRAHGYQNI
uniref:Lysosome-associated membrane glycoprotein 5 n=1 Tax=Schistocephalus solidus TaxID=70667 RepID=A0A0X3Q2U2_SCHSO